jgi:hypothetical protein
MRVRGMCGHVRNSRPCKYQHSILTALSSLILSANSIGSHPQQHVWWLVRVMTAVLQLSNRKTSRYATPLASGTWLQASRSRLLAIDFIRRRTCPSVPSRFAGFGQTERAHAQTEVRVNVILTSCALICSQEVKRQFDAKHSVSECEAYARAVTRPRREPSLEARRD